MGSPVAIETKGVVGLTGVGATTVPGRENGSGQVNEVVWGVYVHGVRRVFRVCWCTIAHLWGVYFIIVCISLQSAAKRSEAW